MSVYFMQSPNGGPVKIGFSDNVARRHLSLQCHYGQELIILATLDGTSEVEQEMHERFSHLRIGRTEQFRPGLDLMEFVGLPILAHANPDTVEAMPSRHTGTISVKIDAIVLGKVQMIAKAKGVSVAEYLTELVRAPVDRDFVKIMEKMKGSE